ncbi:MAG: hypothetical protein WC946_09400 [Bacteroidales bacterium]
MTLFFKSVYAYAAIDDNKTPKNIAPIETKSVFPIAEKNATLSINALKFAAKDAKLGCEKMSPFFMLTDVLKAESPISIYGNKLRAQQQIINI